MAIKTFVGGAAAATQVDDYTPANVGVGDIFTLTLTTESGTTVAVSFTATAATVANVTAGLTAAWNANSVVTEYATATDNTTKLTLTAAQSGQPFSVATSTTDGNSSNTQTLTKTSVTPNAGPYDYACIGNWLEGSIPTAADNVVISTGSILYNLNQSAISIGSFTIAPGHSGSIGANGRRLRIAPTALVSYGTGTYWLDIGSANIAPRIARTATTTSTSGVYGTNLLGSNMSGLVVESGTVGVATAGGETSTVATAQLLGGSLTLGSGVTLTTYNQYSGTGEINSAATTVSVDGGTLTTKGTGAVTTMTNNGGNIVSNSTGTITTLNQNKGTTDFTQSRVARTVTTTTVTGGILLVDSAVLTMTNKIASSGHLRITAEAA